jgi:hypothetical protein
MKYQWILLVLMVLVLAQCSPSTKEQTVGENDLDKILGDKLLDVKTGKIRDNNFMDLIGMETHCLAIPSKLYEVEKITEDLYLLKQRKTYTNARRFSILLETNEGQVIQYESLDDWDVVQFASKEGNIVLLCHNFDYYDDYWIRNQNAMTIMEYDNTLQKQWQYEPNNKSLLIEGLGLEVFSNKIKATINIITGCHICTNEIELELDEKGNCKQAKEISKKHSATNFSIKELKNFFVKE